MAKFTLDYTGEQINEALGLALNGSTDALKKTGDTMEGVLKFTPEVHYGDTLPETGETGQIYFVEAEEAFLENKDGVVQANNVAPNAIVTDKVANKAITRAKLANDALYSPILYSTTNRELTIEDLGKTVYSAWNTSVTFTMNAENSATFPIGAEIAICRWGGADIDVIVQAEGLQFSIPGESSSKTDAAVRIADSFGLIALKKMSNGSTYGNNWLVTGNVEVVS